MYYLFGNALREALVKEQISPTKLAEMVGVKTQTILRWLRGDSYPSNVALLKTALSLKNNNFKLINAVIQKKFDNIYISTELKQVYHKILGEIIGDATISNKFNASERSDLYNLFDEIINQFNEYPYRTYFLDENETYVSEIFILPEPKIALLDDWHMIISSIKKNPSELYNLNWKKFEDLMAHLLENFGWEIFPMGYTKDDGIDILAVRKVQPGIKFTMMVQCKKYSQDRKVGVSVVKDVWATKWEKGLHHAMIATTSSFTKGAITKADSWNFDLRNHDGILEMCKEYGLALNV